VARGVLGALRLGSAAAGELVPRVLDLLGAHHAQLRASVDALVQRVPPWRFVRWVSQLVSRLQTLREGDTALAMLTAVAAHWPQPVFYALNFAPRGERVNKLAALVHSDLLSMFVHQCRCLTHPELRWKAIVDNIKHILSDEPSVVQRRALLAPELAAAADLVATDSTSGDYNVEFIKRHGRNIEAALGTNPLKTIESLTSTQWGDLLKAHHVTVLTPTSDSKAALTQLGQFSKYLSQCVRACVRACESVLTGLCRFDANWRRTVTSDTDIARDGIEVPGWYNVLSPVSAMMSVRARAR
jgi:hypothetical protein